MLRLNCQIDPYNKMNIVTIEHINAINILQIPLNGIQNERHMEHHWYLRHFNKRPYYTEYKFHH